MQRPGLRVMQILGIVLGVQTALFAHLNPSGWRVVDFSSENLLTGELARHAVDGDPETQWHTQWHDTRGQEAAQPPHFITLGFGETVSVNALRYRGRAHGEGGIPKAYSVELSRDGNEWIAVAQGELQFRGRMSVHADIPLQQPVYASFLRFTVESLHETGKAREAGLVVGELDVATPESPLTPTTLIPVPQSREWNYGGYRWSRRHRALLAYAKAHPARLVFLGDSINHRWGAAPYDSTPRTGQAVWEHYYGHRQSLCLGYGWDRLENMLWRLQHGELASADPCLVVLMAGTNNMEVNTPEDIAAGVTALCDEIHRQKPQAHILLLAIFPRGANRHYPDLDEANRFIKRLGQREYITFRDIGPAFLNAQGELTRAVMPDLLHPSEEGYRRWARAIEADVSRILGDTPVAP